MNAVSYGWWQDLVYQYNDADHIVLKDATEGENRARITSRDYISWEMISVLMETRRQRADLSVC